jgi:hypothetical protein
MLWVANGRRQLDLLVPAIALAFALPFGWENTLLGFQSTFYLLLLFSILALWLTTRYRGGSAAWLLGWLCALCALFAAANGVTVPVVIAAVVALKLLSDRSDWRSSLLTLTAAGAVVALGLLTASPPLPHHEPLAAKTLADLVGTLGRNLAWPWIQSPWLSVAMWLPIAGLSILVAARRGQTTPLQRMVLGLGFWVILQAAAIAYGRGAGAPAPAPRYQDFLSLGFVANSVALLIVFDVGPFRGTARRLATVALASWVAVAGVGLHRLVWSSLEQLSVFQPFFNAHTSNVRQFMLDGDIAKFASKQPLVELPYHTPQSLAGMLVEPYIRRILPAAVRAPVVVAPRASSGGSFVPNGTYPLTPSNPLLRSWGSYTAQGDATEGRFESEVLEPCRAGNHLQFEVAGYLGTGGLSLMIKDLPSGREREVAPAKPAKESWLPVQIACPAGSFQIVAVDGRADSWFAFREPVEVGVATPAAEWLIDVSPTLMVVAFAIALVAARSSARATAAGPS